ncbi:MAG TPA: zf-HC2 domain-containing protein [Candidatus Acidoferrales bacterium]|nr:zf-HC2 domain-containing protein [Candidatus Acidoferrales bacterium]
MSWNCTTTEERLTDYLDGALTPAEAAAFSAHTAGCAACAKIVSQVSALVNQMPLVEPLEPPVHLTAKILDATLGPRTNAPDWRRWFDWVSVIWQPRFGMGVATVAASFAVMFHAFAPVAKKITLADLSPVAVARTANRQVHLTYAHGVKFVNDLRVVYEIESRLGPQPAQISIPIIEPQAPPPSRPSPSSTNPHEKSQAVPHSNRREASGGGSVAFAEATGWPDGSTTRSLQ